MRGSLELVIQDSDLISKILPTTFQGFARSWYNNLEPSFIKGFGNLYAKLVACFSTSIFAKKSSMNLFGVTQQEGKSTRVYLNRFNEEMLKMEELLELVALEALIRGVRDYAL
jgi:hypothetical protein